MFEQSVRRTGGSTSTSSVLRRRRHPAQLRPMAAMRTKLPTAALVLRSAYNATRPRLTPQGVVGEIKGQNVAKANADFGFLPESMWIGSAPSI